MLAAILVNGLVLSGIYGMLALGFALTYGVARILNLAHTAFYMAAAYALFFFLGLMGFAPAALLSALLVLGLALLAYWFFLEPSRSTRPRSSSSPSPWPSSSRKWPSSSSAGTSALSLPCFQGSWRSWGCGWPSKPSWPSSSPEGFCFWPGPS